jgi:hypothetical protein
MRFPHIPLFSTRLKGLIIAQKSLAGRCVCFILLFNLALPAFHSFEGISKPVRSLLTLFETIADCRFLPI